MTNQQTSDEMKAECVAAMGEELGTTYHALWQEVAQLHLRWIEFKELYGTDQDRVDLLNKTAPPFFRLVQDALWEQTLLHIARLTDPPNSAGKANLTIKRLPTLIDNDKLRQEVEQKIIGAETACFFCRGWRNKTLAHTDFEVATQNGVQLAPASPAKIKEALDSLTNVLNVISKHFYDSQSCFGTSPDARGGVALLSVLEAGLTALDERRQRDFWRRKRNK